MKTTLLTFFAITIALLLIPAVTVYGQETPSGIPFDQLEYEIDAFMAQHIDDIAGAAIVVVSDGEIIFSRGYGYANMAEQIPIDPAYHVFEHASINKVFVWTAAMQLVEQGLLDLDRYVHYYLSPESQRDFAFTYPVTMRHLMNHSAGFEETIVGMFTSHDQARTLTLREGLLPVKPVQIFAPGVASTYSNWGTAFAAYVVGSIMGVEFYVYESQHIFAPAGMANSLNQPHWIHRPDFLNRMPSPYLPNHHAASLFYSSIYPTGASRGTAEDLARFIIALTPPAGESGPLFNSRAGLDLLFSSSASDPINRPMMHHGFFHLAGYVDAFGHGGDMPGASVMFGIVPEARFGWVVLQNQGAEVSVRLGLGQLLTGTQMAEAQQMSAPDNLPSTSIVEGRFVSARRVESNLTALTVYMSPSTITAVDDEIIRLSMMGFNGYYRQVAPFVYRLVEQDFPLFAGMMDTIHFVVEGETVTHVNMAPLDLVPLPRAFGFVMGSLGVVLLAVLFFFIGLIVLVVKLVRKKLAFKNVTVGLFLSGFLLLLPNVVFFMIMASNPFGLTTSLVNTVAILNYIFAALVLLFTCGNIAWIAKKGSTVKGNIMFATTAVISLAFMFVLFSWNFFVLM